LTFTRSPSLSFAEWVIALGSAAAHIHVVAFD
jgi:hypothetical protein